MRLITLLWKLFTTAIRHGNLFTKYEGNVAIKFPLTSEILLELHFVVEPVEDAAMNVASHMGERSIRLKNNRLEINPKKTKKFMEKIDKIVDEDREHWPNNFQIPLT